MSPKTPILVTGGAGYIGACVAKSLAQKGYHPVTYDNLSTGKKSRVLYGDFIEGDILSKKDLEALFNKYHFKSCIHLASSLIVSESMAHPLKYYKNNVAGTLNLLEVCKDFKLENFIFSSSAAVYGEGEDGSGGCFSEDDQTIPINPYGKTKLMIEQVLKDFSLAYNFFKFISLRYFNVAGADLEDLIGEEGSNLTHLITLAVHAACKKRDFLELYGRDYPTKDKTCVRDYIHVLDLAELHVKALEFLKLKKESQVFNCGYGRGYSVLEVIEAVKKVGKVDFIVKDAARRQGDPAFLVANVDKIKSKLSWAPIHDNLLEIVRSAFEFEKTR